MFVSGHESFSFVVVLLPTLTTRFRRRYDTDMVGSLYGEKHSHSTRIALCARIPSSMRQRRRAVAAFSGGTTIDIRPCTPRTSLSAIHHGHGWGVPFLGVFAGTYFWVGKMTAA